MILQRTVLTPPLIAESQRLVEQYPTITNLHSVIDYQKNLVILPSYNRDEGKSFATEFYIIKLSDLDLKYIGPAPNRRHDDEWVYKLLNHQVVKWIYDYNLEEYVKQNEYKPRFYKTESHDDYYN